MNESPSCELQQKGNKAVQCDRVQVRFPKIGRCTVKIRLLRSGGRTVKQLRDKYKRVTVMTVTSERTGAARDDANYILPIIEATRPPRSVKPECANTNLPDANKPRGFQFSERFFQDFIAHNVPMLKDVLVIVGEWPHLQRYIGFLGWRSWAASSRPRSHGPIYAINSGSRTRNCDVFGSDSRKRFRRYASRGRSCRRGKTKGSVHRAATPGV
jgi:hypothetical protein